MELWKDGIVEIQNDRIQKDSRKHRNTARQEDKNKKRLKDGKTKTWKDRNTETQKQGKTERQKDKTTEKEKDQYFFTIFPFPQVTLQEPLVHNPHIPLTENLKLKKKYLSQHFNNYSFQIF